MMFNITLWLQKFKKYIFLIQNPPFSVIHFIKKTHLTLFLAGIIYMIYGFLADQILMIHLNVIFIGLIIFENLMRAYLLYKIPSWLKKPINIFFRLKNNSFCFLIFIVLLSSLSRSFTTSSSSFPSSSSSSPSSFLPFLKGFLSLLLLLLWLHLQSFSTSLLLLLSSFLLFLFLSFSLHLSEIILIYRLFLKNIFDLCNFNLKQYRTTNPFILT